MFVWAMDNSGCVEVQFTLVLAPSEVVKLALNNLGNPTFNTSRQVAATAQISVIALV
jgi:hypothetical protein